MVVGGGDDMVEECAIPLLRLHNWATSPLPISLFNSAALSPSRTRLLLLSHNQQALIVPLKNGNGGGGGGGDSAAAAASSPMPLPMSPYEVVSFNPLLTPPSTPPRPSNLDERGGFDPGATPSSSTGFQFSSQSTPYATPAFVPKRASHGTPGLFEPSIIATPYFTPAASTPSLTASSSPTLSSERTALSSSAADSEPKVIPSCFHTLPAVECFSWACCGDEFAANRESGPFKEILVIAGKEGLVLHAFCGKDDGKEEEEGLPAKDDRLLQQGVKQLEGGEFKGRWRIWGWQEGGGSKNPGVDLGSDREREKKGGGGKRALRFLDENSAGPDDSSFEGLRENGGSGFQSFIVDGQLEPLEGTLQLQFSKHQPWPASAECVSFCISYVSTSFNLLSRFAQTVATQSERQDLEEPSAILEHDLRIVRLLSNPAQNLVALVLVKWSAEQHRSDAKENLKEEFHASSGLGGIRRDEVLDDFFFVIARISCWGLECIARVDSSSATKAAYASEATIPPWADFQLSDDVFVALREDGMIYLWRALTGKFISRINVSQFCRVNLGLEGDAKKASFSRVVEMHRGKETPEIEVDKTTGGSQSQQAGVVRSGEGDDDSTQQVVREGESPKAGKGRVETLENTSEGGSSGGTKKNPYVQVAVTADCLLIAISDSQGLVFLVSTDEYFALPDSAFHQGSGDCHDLRLLSSYEVAGSDIGGTKRCSAVPNRDWLNWSAEEDEKKTITSGAGDIITNKQWDSRENELLLSPENTSFGDYLLGASGFTSRERIALHRNSRGPGLARTQFRKIFVPSKPSNSFLGMSLNSYGITRIATSNARGEFTLTQHGLRVMDKPVGGAQLIEKEASSILKENNYPGNVVAFSFRGCLYIVSATALHVVLPTLAILPPQPVCHEGMPWLGLETGARSNRDCLLRPTESSKLAAIRRQWQTEVLDRCLVYDNLEEAEQLCLENGWSLQLMRLRRLQLALDYVQVDEVEQALEALLRIGAAEAGVPRVLFAAVELMLSSFGSDNELAQASRLLELAARFLTRLIRSHGVSQQHRSAKNETLTPGSLAPSSHNKPIKFKPPSQVSELAYLLEVIRSVQSRLQAKRKGHSRGTKADANGEASGLPGDGASKMLPIIELPAENSVQIASEPEGAVVSARGEQPKAPPSPENVTTSSALVTTGVLPGSGGSWGLSVGGSEDGKSRRGSSPESAGEMFARWESEEVDAENVVRDALRAGRVPLAVVQLHRIRSKAFIKGSQDHRPKMIDVFQDVQEIGRGIVYELLCKGKTTLAMAALRRLGEDIEVVLYELAFGTMRRSLRKQMRAELRRSSNRLGSRDSQLLEITTFLEDLCPSSSFWSTYRGRQIRSGSPSVEESASTEEDGLSLRLECDSGMVGTFILQCGEVDGVVLGSWKFTAAPEALDSAGGEQESPAAGYLVLATAWLHAWDQGTVDRVILDQLLIPGKHTSWRAQLEYYAAHHNWAQVSALLDNIPHSVLYDGELQVHLDQDEDFECHHDEGGHPDLDSADEHSPRAQPPKEVNTCVPKVHILGMNMRPTCSAWLWHMMEVKLAKSLIFLRIHWQGTSELISLIATAGLLFQRSPARTSSNTSKQRSTDAGGNPKETLHRDTMRALHEVVVRHCVKYSLVNLLERYINYHSLALDKGSAVVMQSVVGNCDWAQWLFLSRLKGREYEASFANALTISAQKSDSGHGLAFGNGFKSMIAVDGNPIRGREIMAMATLMYGSLPVQKCLVMGSANKEDLRSWYCSMEDLRPGLQSFPTLWHTLVATCYGHDAWSFVRTIGPKTGGSSRGLLGYLEWREALFQSAAGDTSLFEMLPRWLPKNVRRLLQLGIQGAVGGQMKVAMGEGAAGERVAQKTEVGMEETSVLRWEDSIRNTVEEELYAFSPEEAGMGVEYHLRRGRPLAAFNSLLSTRVHNAGSYVMHSSRNSPSSFETQILLSSLTESDESLIASVLPLAITHYDNTVVVAACVSFLELCGLSADLLQVDVAALSRITTYLKEQDSSKGSLSSGPQEDTVAGKYSRADFARSLARALADEYTTAGIGILTGKTLANSRRREALMAILPLLEKASLRYDGQKRVGSTAGAWLMNGVGNGSELRAVQRSMSERWSLVTAFCRGHQLPLSTTYLSTLAKYNDWVGFLAEAQIECCSIDVLLKVASKEFTDLRLQSHILTVLKCLPAALQKPSTPASKVFQFPSGSKGDALPGSENGILEELFALLAECEIQKQPGQELLAKAKDFRWPLLAIVASCFPDVTSLSCLTVWLEITAARETSAIRVNDVFTHISAIVGAAVKATNAQLENGNPPGLKYKRGNPKRQCLMLQEEVTPIALKGKQQVTTERGLSEGSLGRTTSKVTQDVNGFGVALKDHMISANMPTAAEEQESLAAMVAVLCEQQRFVPLLRAFELFTPTSPLLPFIRFLQAFAQMRLPEAGAHLTTFSGTLKDEQRKQHSQQTKILKSNTTWITAAAVAAADAMLEACPSPYERRCLLQLLSAADFGDGGLAAIRFRRLYWKMQLAEPALCSGLGVVASGVDIEDDALLRELENSGHWEEARTWAGQLDLSSLHTSSALHHVTETQAEAMVAEWKEMLWDVREERAALWGHCQALFTRHSYPPLRAGLFYLKHADAVEGEVPTSELHGILLLALQWLSGSFNDSSPVYPLHLLHELEIRIWLLAVESEVEAQAGRDQETVFLGRSFPPGVLGNTGLTSNDPTAVHPVDRTAVAVAIVDSHLKKANVKSQSELSSEDSARGLARSRSMQIGDVSTSRNGSALKIKRRTKQLKRTPVNTTEDGAPSDSDDNRRNSLERRSSLDRRDSLNRRSSGDRRNSLNRHHSLPYIEGQNREGESGEPEDSFTPTDDGTRGWEERVGEGEVERAVLALVEVGQVTAARQLQQKLAPSHVPLELLLVEAAQNIATLSVPTAKGSVVPAFLHPTVEESLRYIYLPADFATVTPLQVLNALMMACREGCGRGQCQRIAAIAKVGNFLGLSFTEAFSKSPPQLLQLLSLKGKEAVDEAKLLVATHALPAATIAKILAESFLKGLLAAHRGGYMETSYREEGPAPLLWRPSDFKDWAQLCPAEPEVGHALMRLVISARDIPHSCEVEIIILAHCYYESSACLDGIDVLVSLAATRVDSYVAQGDFTSLARLVTGVSNFQRLRFILDLLIENGRLQLLLRKRVVYDAAVGSSAGFCMAVLSSLKHFNPYDQDAFIQVYSHFNMPHEMAILLRSRAWKSVERWVMRNDPEQSEELLEPMRLYVEAAEVYAGMDAGMGTSVCCAQASLISLQLRMPELMWLNLTETNARRRLVEQPRFQEALVVAEAYDLNQSAEWVPVLWSQMLQSGRIDQFLTEFVAALPLPASMLMELARFYRAEVSARGDHLDFTKWLTPGGVPLEHTRYLGKSMRSLLKLVRDIRVRVQLATVATGFPDVVDACLQMLDKVPESAGPLILRKGHGGTYIPLM